jgi:hypothetical protein
MIPFLGVFAFKGTAHGAAFFFFRIPISEVLDDPICCCVRFDSR